MHYMTLWCSYGLKTDSDCSFFCLLKIHARLFYCHIKSKRYGLIFLVACNFQSNSLLIQISPVCLRLISHPLHGVFLGGIQLNSFGFIN